MALACLGLMVFSIPITWIAWRIRREVKRGLLFRQPRIGYGGRGFVILKFRSMSESGSIPPFCGLLRTTAMDELPQLINILRGEMSFVGPRPLIPEELQDLHRIPNGVNRFSVRPGLTGLAQINSDKVPNLSERLQWDLAYVERSSFLLDIRILVKSVLVTLRGGWEKHLPGHGIL